MKTLADLKRRLRVGLVIQCEHHTRPEISGRREIVKVQTNAISYLFNHPTKGQMVGWWWFPKAGDLVFDGGDRVTIRGRTNEFTYTVPA